MAGRISLISLGCPKNLVDSDNLLRSLIGIGLRYSENPEDADILLINTCGFIEDAKKESIEEILKLASIKKTGGQEGKRARLVVFGCLAKRYGDELIKEIPDIDAIFGVGEDEKIVEYVNSLKVRKCESSEVNVPASRLPDFRSSHAYLKISEGCNKRCSYCVIPSLRGKYRSIKPDEILKEADSCLQKGAKELILVGQDTACYGRDIGYDISRLLRDVSSLSGDFWIRLLYTYPASITDPLLNVIADEKKICKYMDIPLQHSEDRILKLMKRAGTRKEYLELIKRIRLKIPDIALRTTFIVGFPSETEDEFNSLVDFIEDVRFDRLGVFRYSNEEGTPASKLKGQISEAVKKKRVDRVMRHQAKISLEKNRELIGKQFNAIIDEVSHGVALGRLCSHAPEIDGLVIIEDSGFRIQNSGHEIQGGKNQASGIRYPASRELKTGNFVKVKIIDAYDYDLKGIIVR